MTVVLVVNSGSSSIKYQVIETDAERVLAKGLIERVGTDHATIHHTRPNGDGSFEQSAPDHRTGFRAMLTAFSRFGPSLDQVRIEAVGHRVVQGGSRFVTPTVIDESVMQAIDDLAPLAPLHNPPNLLGIQGARDAFPDVPHVAVFDTAFHQTMPPSAYTYAIGSAVAAQHGIRRYGFHGTSHKYVAELAAAHLGIAFERFNAITLHIGNGVSACAIRAGKSVATSMGMTPLEGLVMGTRSGDIDPGIVFHLHREAGMSMDRIDDLLNRRSGLLGLADSSDMRDVEAAARGGDAQAKLALQIYCRRIRHYVGAYFTEVAPLHAVVFTAGVGEHSSFVRAESMAGLQQLGIELDRGRNDASGSDVRRISSASSQVAVLVAPTNEELEIARQTVSLVA